MSEITRLLKEASGNLSDELKGTYYRWVSSPALVVEKKFPRYPALYVSVQR